MHTGQFLDLWGTQNIFTLWTVLTINICNRPYYFYFIEEEIKFIKDKKFACHKFMYSIIQSQIHLSSSKARLLNAGIYWFCTISCVTWGESLDRKIISQFTSTIIFFTSLNKITCTTLIDCSFPMLTDIILIYYEINQWKS